MWTEKSKKKLEPPSQSISWDDQSLNIFMCFSRETWNDGEDDRKKCFIDREICTLWSPRRKWWRDGERGEWRIEMRKWHFKNVIFKTLSLNFPQQHPTQQTGDGKKRKELLTRLSL